ncbi:MAG: DUF2510 domain-containing protein [Micrococcales bacterium]|nr:DUF2510 domain-containing protein [Micrococcales bacterium]
MSHDTPQAGWYPNPDGTGGLRWWSGVGWTEYTRPNPEGEHAAEQPTAVLPEPTTPLPPEPTAPVPAAAWGQPGGGQPAPPPQTPSYAAYTPPPGRPLTASGMRPLGGMFSDIGRITRRAWWPILAISVAIWVGVSAVLAVITFAVVDTGALRAGLDTLGAALEANPEGDFSQAEVDAMTSEFSRAFSALPLGGWVVLGALLSVLLLIASTVQIGAVNRLGMDAAATNRVSWAAAWRSGFVAGFRLFGYYVLLVMVMTAAVVAVTVVIVLTAQFAPALAIGLGILAFFGFFAVSFWLTGRLIPAVAQAVVGRRALSWSWRATRGKFWGVLGRYLLWSLAASVIVNVITTVVSIPISLLFLGQATSTADPSASLGLALTLNLVLLPLSMALAAITVMGIVPIWRDLTDDPVYRSIDAQGVPVTPPGD